MYLLWKSLSVPQKVKPKNTDDPVIPLLGISSRNLCPKKNLYMNIYRRIIYNSQKTGTNPNIYQLRTGKIWSIQLFVTTKARQAPLSMEFSRKENWSEEPFPSPGDLPDPRIKLGSPKFQGDSLPSGLPRKPISIQWHKKEWSRVSCFNMA